MAPERCRNVIIGSGEGGKHLAWDQARLGQPTIVIERRWLCGSCANIDCLPSNVIATAIRDFYAKTL